MSDLSVRPANASAQSLSDALMRASGGQAAVLMIPATPGDAKDAGQLGLDAPNFQGLSLSPTIFRRTRATMTANQPAQYELLISAIAVAQQVSVLQLPSADALFAMAASVIVAGLQMLIEAWSCSVALGQPMLYRLVVRAAEPESVAASSS